MALDPKFKRFLRGMLEDVSFEYSTPVADMIHDLKTAGYIVDYTVEPNGEKEHITEFRVDDEVIYVHDINGNLQDILMNILKIGHPYLNVLNIVKAIAACGYNVRCRVYYSGNPAQDYFINTLTIDEVSYEINPDGDIDRYPIRYLLRCDAYGDVVERMEE